MRFLLPILFFWTLTSPLSLLGAPDQAAKTSHPFAVTLPAVQLRNQEGADVRLVDELARHDIVLLNFVFTSCPTICPIMGANFAQLSKAIDTAGVHDTALVSITLDPAVDSPERLKEWAAQFRATDTWKLFTGAEGDIKQVLKAFSAFTPDKSAHAPFIMLGRPARNQWLRLEGTPAADEVLRAIASLRGPETPVSEPSTTDRARAYFPDVILTNQDGKTARLYTDLLQDKVVVMNAFFARCSGVCTATMPALKALQEELATRDLASRVQLLSFTVDPTTDTPQALKTYAQGLGARPGWDFLTGDAQAMDTALAKLGFKADSKEAHGSVFIVGNVSTGHLAKVPGVVSLAQLEKIVDEVLAEEP